MIDFIGIFTAQQCETQNEANQYTFYYPHANKMKLKNKNTRNRYRIAIDYKYVFRYKHKFALQFARLCFIRKMFYSYQTVAFDDLSFGFHIVFVNYFGFVNIYFLYDLR